MEETRYDVLKAQIKYIEEGGRGKMYNSKSDGNHPWIDEITKKLAEVCDRVDDSAPCEPPCYMKDGMCICG